MGLGYLSFFKRGDKMNVIKWCCIVFFALHVNAKSAFELTPEMYASLMAKSLEGNHKEGL